MTDENETALGDGGPAFPHDKYQRREDGQWGSYASGGMSLRDWFAGQVMVGILPHPKTLLSYGENITTGDNMLAQNAYRIADAMLAARAKGGAK